MEFSKKTYTVEEALNLLKQYCSYRERCHREVEQKLMHMNMIPIAREKIIISLLDENFLNEERFARSFARGKFRIKKWGRIRIVNELKQRKISRYNINAALKEIDEKEYNSTFFQLAEKKMAQLNEPNIFKLKKKLADYLILKGYESHMVYDYLSTL